MRQKVFSIATIILLFITLSSNHVFSQQNNIALNKPVTATSEDTGNPAENAVDGKISRNSKWMAASGRAPHIFEIDLRKYYKINEIRMHSGILDEEKLPDEKIQAAGFWSVKNFKVQYWDDANWSDFPNTEIMENRLITVVFKFKPKITTFKIRLVSDDGEPISIMEIEVFGTEAENMPAPPYVTSDLKTSSNFTEKQAATITVDTNSVGKTMKYVGYNQGYYFPESNVSGWLEYSNVNSLRVWTSLNSFVPASAVQVDPQVETVAEFDKRKEELRKDPENNKFIKWDNLYKIYSSVDSSSTNAMVLDYALAELKRLNIQPLLQISTTEFEDNWSNKWKQWQRYYALAYYTAKTGDAAMFAMQNEPNHRHSGPMKMEQWIMGMQIVSDAVHNAVEDVNKNYGKDLQAKFIGPVTAGQNTDWWAGVIQAIRTDYHGNTVDKDLIDIFSTHSYNSPAAGYDSRVSNIREVITNNHPEGKALPIVFTEIGRWMNAYLIDKEETMDSPSLFTEWAGIYSNNMKNGGYGMWAFKFANTTSGAYPKGIKSGHHFTWQGKRIVEDAYKNLALSKPVKSSSENKKKDRFVTDGDKSDNSRWVSDSTASDKWLEIDLGTSQELGSAVVYTGSSYGVYTGHDRIKNLKLQYLDNSSWKDIPGTVQKDFRYVQFFTEFPEPITTRKVRFVILDKGVSEVREIKLFAQGDGPSNEPDYNISGIQRTGEVVRLFAKGFKEERNLLETTASVNDPGLDTYTSYDRKSGNYYMWLVQRGLFDYELAIDLSKLPVSAGAPVTAETVDEAFYGEVANISVIPENKEINLTLPRQSVVLLTIPSGNLKKQTILPDADATVSAGPNAAKNYGGSKEMTVALDAAKTENNKVAYIHFDGANYKAEKAKRILLAVNGEASGDNVFRLHVYGIPSEGFDQDKITWQNAPQLDPEEALIHGVGQTAFVAGQLAFDNKSKYHYLDVTDLVKMYGEKGITFAFVRETRHLGDDEDKGQHVSISSMEAGHEPELNFWIAN